MNELIFLTLVLWCVALGLLILVLYLVSVLLVERIVRRLSAE